MAVAFNICLIWFLLLSLLFCVFLQREQDRPQRRHMSFAFGGLSFVEDDQVLQLPSKCWQFLHVGLTQQVPVRRAVGQAEKEVPMRIRQLGEDV